MPVRHASRPGHRQGRAEAIIRQPSDAPGTQRPRPAGYQPPEAELEAGLQIDATPAGLVRALLQPVGIEHSDDDEELLEPRPGPH